MVDLRRRNLARKAALTEPALVKQSAHFLDRRSRILEDLDGFIHHLFHALQLGFPTLKVRDLGLGDFGRNSGKSRKAQHQMRLKLMQPIFGQDDGRHLEGIVPLEVDSVESTECGRDLILRADIFLDDLLLHMDGLGGQFVFGNILPTQGGNGMDQSHRERRAGSKP